MSKIVVSRVPDERGSRGCFGFSEFIAVLFILTCSCFLAYGVIYGCSRSSGAPSVTAPTASFQPTLETVASRPDTMPTETAATRPVTALPEAEPSAPLGALPVTGSVDYEFGTALGEREAVEDSWFDDAVFLGDSRTEGLQLFSGLTHGDFFWHRGMNVFRADDEKYACFDVGGEKTTLLGTLSAKKYKAVYLMLGINELGYPEEVYSDALSGLVDAIVEAQPEAVLFLQTMPPVNDKKAADFGVASYINTANVDKFNARITEIAAEKQAVLLDTASVYLGPDGQLPPELTGDGVHFTASGYKRWADFLRVHTMEPEEYLELRGTEE